MRGDERQGTLAHDHHTGHDPETRRSLLTVFRSLAGLDATAVEHAFTEFVHKHPRLSSQELRFLQVSELHCPDTQ